MGKLYLNYPMVEAFYHMKNIPDVDYNSYTVSMDELRLRTYKQRVNFESRNHDYSKFAINRSECNIVIHQNIDKAWGLTEIQRISGGAEFLLPDSTEILQKQLLKIRYEKVVSVLCTCVFYIVDYNPRLIRTN